MKRISLVIIFGLLFIVGSLQAQHSLQVDNGAGAYTTITGTNTTGNYTLPSGSGTLLGYNGDTSFCWLSTGNAGTHPASNPLLFNPSTNTFIGTADNKELDFGTNGAIRARFKESTGDTATAGCFEPGLAATYCLGTIDRPWQGVTVGGGATGGGIIIFTGSPGAHKPGDHNPTPQVQPSGSINFNTGTNSFNFSQSINISGQAVINYGSAGNAVDVTMAGNGWAGQFNGTGLLSNGLYASGAAGKTGLQVNAGDIILSHTNQPTGAFSIGAGTSSVVAVSSGAAAGYNITLNTGTNGQIVYVYNGDAAWTATLIAGTSGLHPQNTGGNSIAPGNTKLLIYVTNAAGSGWITK